MKAPFQKVIEVGCPPELRAPFCVLDLVIAASGAIGAVGLESIGARYVSLLATCLALLALGTSLLVGRRAEPASEDHPAPAD